MAIEITMPQLSDTMDEGTILSWLKKEGDAVERGDALAEVETDKADLEIESFHEGVLLKIHSPEGSTVKVGQVIALVGQEGEVVSQKQSSSESSAVNGSPAAEAEVPQPKQACSGRKPGQLKQMLRRVYLLRSLKSLVKPRISPLARNLAKAHGLDVSSIVGSGEGGRIVKRDIEIQLGTEIPPAAVEQAVSGGKEKSNAAPAPLKAAKQAPSVQSRPVEARKPAPAFICPGLFGQQC